MAMAIFANVVLLYGFLNRALRPGYDSAQSVTIFRKVDPSATSMPPLSSTTRFSCLPAMVGTGLLV